MRTRSAILLSAAVLVGCASEYAGMSADSASVFLADEGLSRRAYTARQRQAAVAAYEVPTPPDALPAIPRLDSNANMVIRTATASVEVNSLETALIELKQLAARLGGYIANSGIEVGSSRLRQAVIELKIPAARFEEALSGLTPIGKLESVNVTAQDVGEEFVDVTARMENSRRLERRLIELLVTRTGKLKDVLDVENALARVREEIERYEGRIRYLRAHTAMSTLTVTAHEPIPIVATAGRGVMGEAFRQAWRNFVLLISLAVQSLGVILPLGAVAIVAWIVTRRVRMARQRAA